MQYTGISLHVDVSSITPLPSLLALRTVETTPGKLFRFGFPLTCHLTPRYSVVFRYDIQLSQRTLGRSWRGRSKRGSCFAQRIVLVLQV